jgi:hypothetical protein
VEKSKKVFIGFLALLSAGVLLLSIVAAIVLNSGFLDRFAKDLAVKLFNEEFYGHLELQKVKLNFPNKVTILSPRIYEPDEDLPALSADKVTLRFNFLTILKPKIDKLSFRKIKVDSLLINVIERENGKRNIDLIFTSRKPDSTDAPIESFFSKVVTLRNSSLNYSRTLPNETPLALTVQNISLYLNSLRLKIKKKEFGGTIEALALDIPQHSFRLKQGSGQFFVSEKRADIIALKATSDKSNAELSLSLDKFNIFDPDQKKLLLAGKSFLDIQALNIHTRDLNMIYPDIALPEGVYSLKGDARSQSNTIEIIKGVLAHNKSHLAVKGKLLNVQNKNAFGYQLEIDSSKIDPDFFQAFFSDKNQKELIARIGAISFIGKAHGNLKELSTDVHILTKAGNASIKGEAAGEPGKQIKGKGAFSLEKTLPHLFTGTTTAKSMLNATGNFDGIVNGSELAELHIESDLKDSFWQQQALKQGTLSLDYSRELVRAKAILQNGMESIDVSGQISWKGGSADYQAEGKVARLNLAKSLASNDFVTDLNGVFALKGSGFDPASLNAALTARFSPSSINNFRLRDKSELSAAVEQHAASSTVTLKSDFLDLAVQGNQSFKELLGAIELAGSGISGEIRTQSLWSSRPAGPRSDAFLSLKKPFTVSYRILVKDMEPLSPLLPFRDLALQGSADGQFFYENGRCALTSSLDLGSLVYGKAVALKKLSATAAMECSGNGIPKAAIKGKAASLVFSGQTSNNLVFDATYSTGRLTASIDAGRFENDREFSTAFSLQRTGSAYDLGFTKLAIGKGKNRWQTQGGSHIKIEKMAVQFNRFTIANGNQHLVLNGELSNSRPGSFQCNLSHLDLAALGELSEKRLPSGMSGTIDASLTISGNPNTKTSTLSINGKSVGFDKIPLGNVQSNIRHAGNKLSFDYKSFITEPVNKGNTTPSVNTIAGSGTMPLVLAYYPFELRIPQEQKIQASFRSDNLSARFLKVVLPFVEDAAGIMPTTLTVEGTTSRPEIYLLSRLRDTQIKLEATQVTYLLNGDIQVTPRQLELRDLRIADLQNGTGSLNGLLKIENLKPKTITLGANLSKLLLFHKKDTRDEKPFGTIIGSTRNLLLNGDISSPVVEGDITINSADFTMYRPGANESAKYIGVEKFIEFVPRYPSQQSMVAQTDLDSDPVGFNYSLIDILQLKDLKIRSAEQLKFRVIFDRTRGEELEAAISGMQLMVNKSQQRYRLFGSVALSDGKYRFSNTNFDLEDGGKIVWNNVGIHEGIMQNLYGTKYISALSPETGDRDNVKLLLAISGTINEPNVEMGYYLNDQMQPFSSKNLIGGKPSQIDPNAELNVISMLLTSQWYAPQGSSGLSKNLAVSSVGLSTGSGLISSQLSRLVQNVAGFESFNVNLGMNSKGEISGIDLYMAVNVPGTNGKVRIIGEGSSHDVKNKPLFNYYGTSQKVEYRVSPKVYIEAYRSYGQTENEAANTNLQSPTETWGASISYRERFHTWDSFWKRIIPSSNKKK